MMTERLSGRGDVFTKGSGEPVSNVAYDVAITPGGRARLGRIDATIDLEDDVARRLLITNELLTLHLEDGRCLDFLIERVSGFGDVAVVAAGGLYRP